MRRDAVEPGQHGLSVAQRVAPTLRAQKRLLSQVLRLAGVAHDATDIAQDARVVLAERDLGRGLSYRERLRHSVDPTLTGEAPSSVVLGRSDRGLTARRAGRALQGPAIPVCTNRRNAAGSPYPFGRPRRPTTSTHR